VTSAAVSATTGSFSGLEFISGELAILQGCSDETVLKWDDGTSRWQCIPDPTITVTLQSAYNNDADGSDTRITLTSADDSIVYINPAAAGTDSGTLFFIDQNDTTGVTALGIDSEGTDDYALEIRHMGNGAVTAEAGVFVEDEGGGGSLYIHRNLAAATTTGTLIMIHEDDATADPDIMMIQNAGAGLSLRIADSTTDATPVVVTAAGAVGIGVASPTQALDVLGSVALSGDALITGDATITGNDITM